MYVWYSHVRYVRAGPVVVVRIVVVLVVLVEPIAMCSYLAPLPSIGQDSVPRHSGSR